RSLSFVAVSKSNSVDLYRPPALRNNSSEETATAASKENLPETPAIPAKAETTETSTTTSVARKSSPHREQQQASVATAAATRRERRPDRAVYVPRARRSQTTPPTTTTTMPTPTPTATATAQPTSTPTSVPIAATTCSPQSLELPVVDTNSPKADDGQQQQQQQQAKPKKSRSRRERAKKTVGKPALEAATLLVIAPSEPETNQVPPDNNCDKEIMGGAQRTKFGHSGKNHSSKQQQQQQQQPLRIEDVALPRASNTPASDDANKCDNEVRELQRASKEINRSNRRIMKQTFVSDVLEIPDKIDTAATKVNAAAVPAVPAAIPTTHPADSTTEDDDEENEDDWENMFDESGDCLDPKILQELTDSVGKCKIELPKMDYSVYHIKQSLLNEEEFPHVLEISNFPVEFKTPDLLMLFSQYKGTGFDIKWVDDTHALAVFSSSRIAAEVLTMGHPFVKLKPLAEATLESRLKAKKAGATSLQPYRQRPETCTALARRLVSGALGVKLPTAPEERENERRVLREAKERKLLAAKQRDEVWES
ncbi:hypothetical protein KR222_010635, partial [Zaprionus bogoriensis]